MIEALPDFFVECGWASFAISFVGLVLVVLTLAAGLHAWSKPRSDSALPVAAGLLVLALLPASLGEIGFVHGLGAIERFSGVSDGPADRETIRLANRGEALACPVFGLSVSVFPSFGGAVLLGLALARRAGRGLAAPDKRT